MMFSDKAWSFMATASLAEDAFALLGRGIIRSWRVVTFRGEKS